MGCLLTSSRTIFQVVDLCLGAGGKLATHMLWETEMGGDEFNEDCLQCMNLRYSIIYGVISKKLFIMDAISKLNVCLTYLPICSLLPF